MAKASQLSVMISSRCNDDVKLGGVTVNLKTLRERIAAELRTECFFGRQPLDVWISEDADPADGTESSWDYCIRRARESNVVLVLYSGHAGAPQTDGPIGICHAEFDAALASGRARVRQVNLPLIPDSSLSSDAERNKRFQNAVATAGLFRGHSPKNEDDAVKLAKAAVYEAVVELAKLGVREARKSRYDTGDALAWSQYSFDRRAEEMATVALHSLQQAGASDSPGSSPDKGRIVTVAGVPVAFIVHAIPDALTVSAAKERVGQPHLRDHDLIQEFASGTAGPVHLVLCHKTVTEPQARATLGFPDATILRSNFGVYVVDDVQNIQMVFIQQCRDATSTAHGIQRFFEWMRQTQQESSLSQRAVKRSRIVNLIAELQES